MKKLKYITKMPAQYGLTNGKVYTVVGTIKSGLGSLYDKVILINDKGEKDCFSPLFFFVDVTKEYRSEIIDDILK